MGLNAQSLLQGVAVGAPVAGGLMQAGAARAGAQAESQAAIYNARLAEMEGASKAAYVRRAGHRELTSEFVRASAAGGVRVDQGTPLDVQAQHAYEIEREATNAEIEARNTSRLERARARSVRRAGKISAGNALLSGATQAASFGSQLWKGGY